MPRLLLRWIATFAFALASIPATAEFPITVQATARLDGGGIIIAGKSGGGAGIAHLNADGSRDLNYAFQFLTTYPSNDFTGMIVPPVVAWCSRPRVSAAKSC